MNASNLLIVTKSRTFGMLCSVTGSAVSSAAAITGSAEFFAPLTATVPRSAFPPLIRNLSISCFAQCGAQVAARRQFLLRCSSVYTQLQHDDRHSHIVSGRTQSVSGRTHILSTGVRH